MQEPEKVTVADRALIGWHKLSVLVQAKVLEKLGQLAGRPPEQWATEEVERWWPDDDLFALGVWVGTAELLVFFRPAEGGRVRIESMALKETIERFTARKS
jgi:hypothetical protein